MRKILFLGLLPLGFIGCTNIQVQAIDTQNLNKISTLCIIRNPAVQVEDFVPVLEKRLRFHGIHTQLRNASEITDCPTQLHYSARRSWDAVTYLSWAELKLYQNGSPIGQAEYKLKNKGGLSLTKWQSVETKINPVIDELFKNRTTNHQSNVSNEKILIPIKVN